jgi:hypothetical protein
MENRTFENWDKTSLFIPHCILFYCFLDIWIWIYPDLKMFFFLLFVKWTLYYVMWPRWGSTGTYILNTWVVLQFLYLILISHIYDIEIVAKTYQRLHPVAFCSWMLQTKSTAVLLILSEYPFKTMSYWGAESLGMESKPGDWTQSVWCYHGNYSSE